VKKKTEAYIYLFYNSHEGRERGTPSFGRLCSLEEGEGGGGRAALILVPSAAIFRRKKREGKSKDASLHGTVPLEREDLSIVPFSPPRVYLSPEKGKRGKKRRIRRPRRRARLLHVPQSIRKKKEEEEGRRERGIVIPIMTEENEKGPVRILSFVRKRLISLGGGGKKGRSLEGREGGSFLVSSGEKRGEECPTSISLSSLWGGKREGGGGRGPPFFLSFSPT